MKWIIFEREADSTIFLYNGEGCIRISQVQVLNEDTPRWHRDYDKMPLSETTILNAMLSNKQRTFTIPHYGRYRVISRGQTKEF